MLTIGSDPEFIISKNNTPISMIGILPSVFEKELDEEGFAFYHDNVLAECNIPPSSSNEEFIVNIRKCISKLNSKINSMDISCLCYTTYDKKQLSNKLAKEFGCSPDFSAYTFKANKLTAKVMSNVRTAGGHIHIGSDNEVILDAWNKIAIVRLLDVCLGTAITYFEQEWSNGSLRRKYYGQFGQYRDKPYGFEYRTPSNVWLLCPETINFVYSVCKWTVDEFSNSPDKYVKLDRKLIEEGNFESAKDIKKVYHFSEILNLPKDMNGYIEWIKDNCPRDIVTQFSKCYDICSNIQPNHTFQKSWLKH